MNGWYYRMFMNHEDVLKFEGNYLMLKGDNQNLIRYYEDHYSDGFRFITQAFRWSDTPEGWQYWYDMSLKLRVMAKNKSFVRYKSYNKKIMV